MVSRTLSLLVLGLALLAVDAGGAAAQECVHWDQVVGGGPAARRGHAMAYDTDRRKVILFGGVDTDASDEAFNDLWEWDPTTHVWTKVTTQNTPEGLVDHAMAYDAKHKRIIISGGRHEADGDPLDETSIYDPATGAFAVGDDMRLGRMHHAMAYDTARQRIVTFGGQYNDIPDHLNDDTEEWTGSDWVAFSPMHIPDGRVDAAMATFSPGGVAMTGGAVPGVGGSFGTALNSFLVWNGTDWVAPAVVPNNNFIVSKHAMAYDPVRLRLLLFGGSFPQGGDPTRTFALDEGGTQWAVIASGAPGERWDHAMAFAGAADELVLFGGRAPDDEDEAFGDTWILRPHAPTGIINRGQSPVMTSAPCGEINLTADLDPPPDGAPGPYGYHWRRETTPGTFVSIDDNVRRTGTTSATLTIDPARPEDFGRYDVVVSNPCGATTLAPVTLKMIDASFIAGPSLLAGRLDPGLAYDRERQRLVVFGGDTYNDLTPPRFDVAPGQTWESQNGQSFQFVTSTGPERRGGPAMAYDEKRKVTVLFGGQMCQATMFQCQNGGAQQVDYTDTWEWNGATWTQKLVNGPPPRKNGHLVWDPIREKLVLYGGIAPGNTDLTDMWEYDGTSWTQRPQNGDPVKGSPAPRRQFGFAFDRDRGVFVLHGGSHPTSGKPRGDTWEFGANNTWVFKRAEPENGHGGLLSHPHDTLAYDEAHHAMLMFTVPDGNILSQTFGTMRQWNGTSWDEKVTAGPHWVSGGARMVYDSGRQRVFMAGGAFVATTQPPPNGWDWRYFDYEPTCGVVACGDGIVDPPGEECDEPDDPLGCCNSICTLQDAGTICGGAPCDGLCAADGTCQCHVSVCGDGVLEGDEVCEDGSDGCCNPTCTAFATGACGDPCRGDTCVAGGGGTLACEAGTLPTAGCDAQSSVTAFVGALGGLFSTPDESVEVSVPDGATPQRYGIASGLTASQFGVGTAETRVTVARLTPEGATFPAPGVQVKFRWPDTDANGIVDGAAIDERDLRIYKNGVDISGRCGNSTALCGGPTCCNPAIDTFSVYVTSFSEFVLASQPAVCSVLGKPKLGLGKILAPTGDDTLTLQAQLTVPAATALDPVTHGMRIALTDANGTVVDVSLPPGAYVKATKTGWKANKKLTSFAFMRPAAGAEAGIYAAKISRKKDVVTVKVSGKNGDYAAILPLQATIALDTGEPCGTTGFDVGEQACAVKSKGKAVKCK